MNDQTDFHVILNITKTIIIVKKTLQKQGNLKMWLQSFFSSLQIHPFLNPRLNNLFVKHVWRPYRGLRSCDLTKWHTVVAQPITVAVRNRSSYTVPCPKRSNKKDLTVDSWVILIKSVCLWKKEILASLVRKEKKKSPENITNILVSSHLTQETELLGFPQVSATKQDIQYLPLNPVLWFMAKAEGVVKNMLR